MSLFGNKKDEGSSVKPGTETTGCSVKILGTGCAKCNKLTANTKEALSRLGRSDAHLEHVTDIKEIVSYGVMITPALVINGKVKSVGKVLSSDEAGKLLEENL